MTDEYFAIRFYRVKCKCEVVKEGFSLCSPWPLTPKFDRATGYFLNLTLSLLTCDRALKSTVTCNGAIFKIQHATWA